jgi:hypothetical protein
LAALTGPISIRNVEGLTNEDDSALDGSHSRQEAGCPQATQGKRGIDCVFSGMGQQRCSSLYYTTPKVRIVTALSLRNGMRFSRHCDSTRMGRQHQAIRLIGSTIEPFQPKPKRTPRWLQPAGDQWSQALAHKRWALKKTVHLTSPVESTACPSAGSWYCVNNMCIFVLQPSKVVSLCLVSEFMAGRHDVSCPSLVCLPISQPAKGLVRRG